MNLKFWKRGQSGQTEAKAKLARPKEPPERVGMYMVTQLRQDPDWVWSLKAALRPSEGQRHVHDIRLFDPRDAAAKQIEVRDYTTLDSHPELILYAGTFDKDSGKVQLQKPAKAA